MKVLRLDLKYRLPDTFTGGISGALRDLATYLEAPDERTTAPHTISWGPDNQSFAYNCGLDLRFLGTTGLFELIEGQPWRSMAQQRVGGFPSPDPEQKFRWAK